VKTKRYVIELKVERKTFNQFRRVYKTHNHISTEDWFLIYQHIDSTIELFVDNLTEKTGCMMTDSFQILYRVIPGTESIVNISTMESDVEKKVVFGFDISLRKNNEAILIERDLKSKPKPEKKTDKISDWKNMKAM
jgi:hypothetical protein